MPTMQAAAIATSEPTSTSGRQRCSATRNLHSLNGRSLLCLRNDTSKTNSDVPNFEKSHIFKRPALLLVYDDCCCVAHVVVDSLELVAPIVVALTDCAAVVEFVLMTYW